MVVSDQALNEPGLRYPPTLTFRFDDPLTTR